MRKMRFLFTSIVVLTSFSVFSQSKVLDNIIDIEVRNIAEIINNKQIVGYAFFYKIDNLKGAALYRLSILDENLKEIGNNEFEGPKELELKHVSYESERIFLSFFDPSNQEGYRHFIKVFNLKGKEIGLTSYEPEKLKRGWIGAGRAQIAAGQLEQAYQGFQNVEGKGIVSLHQNASKTGGVDIQMIGLNGRLKWEQTITADEGSRFDIYLSGTTSKTILLFEAERKDPMAKDAKIYLIGLDANNGKQFFKKSLDIDGLSFEPILYKTDDNNRLNIVSTIYNQNDKFYVAKPIGFSIGELNDVTGEIKISRNFKFLEDFEKVLNMKNETKSNDGNIKVHDLCLMPNGNMVLVGEFYNTPSQGVSDVTSYFGVPGAKVSVGDLFLLRIGKDNKVIDIDTIGKTKEKYSLPPGLISGLTNRWLTTIKAFGYMYTDEDVNANNRTILARGTFENEKYGTVAITFDDKKGFTKKSFNLGKEKNIQYFVSRGKPGYVMIAKYNSKAKTLSTTLEKVN